jgi:seryl-tRNA synthetase
LVAADGETTSEAARLQPLLDGLFQSTGIDGLYGRTHLYERVVVALGGLISSYRPSGAEVLFFPPVMSRALIQRQGYLKSFPNLLGVVSCLCGDERHIRRTVDQAEDGDDWTAALGATDLVLSPAACYPVYPIAAARGALSNDGLIFDVSSDCFRREPSTDIDRLQSFRMREFVRIGSPEQVLAFRHDWIERGQAIASQLEIAYDVKLASDPFFGRGGELVAKSQIDQALKFELLTPIRSAASATACMSFNYHQDHFGLTWDLTTHEGQIAHTACVAFGIDRLAVALFASHGLEIDRWTQSVRGALRL